MSDHGERIGPGPVTPTDWSLDGVDRDRWRVPAPDDPEEARIMARVVRDLGRAGERELYASRLYAQGDHEPRVAAGASMYLFADVVIPSRIVALVFDEPAGLVIESLRVGRVELIMTDGVPASLFSATTCSCCRDRACQALVGKRWPRMMPGFKVMTCVRNASLTTAIVRAVFVIEEMTLDFEGCAS